MLRVRGTLGRIGGPAGDLRAQDRPRPAALCRFAVRGGDAARHRTEQKAAEQLRAANQWQDTGLVFTTELGAAVEPRNFLRVIEARRQGRAWRVSGCTRCGTVRRWLGWRRRTYQGGRRSARALVIAVTGDIYGHTVDDTARAAVDGLIGHSDCDKRHAADNR